MRLLAATGVETSGAEAVVVGRSMIVGKPVAHLLLAKGADATVTVAHSRTRDLAEVCRRAGEHGLYVFVDFHQDVWSRMTGGDGPG